jgi:hypothetical protein
MDDGTWLCTVHSKTQYAETKAPDCPICLSKVIPDTRLAFKTPCNHVYHRKCINRWFRRGATTCPTCRATVQNPYNRSPPVPVPAPETTPPVTTTQSPDPGPSTGPPSIELRQFLDLIVHVTPSYDEHFYSYALLQNVMSPILSQYLPPDQEIRELIAEVASRSPSSNAFIRFFEDMNII